MASFHEAKSPLDVWHPVLLPLSIAVNALLLVLFATTPARAGYGEGNARLERLYASFISPCCWRENLTVHQSPDANRLRTRIEGMVQDGETDDQIKQMLVGEYGKRILALPEGGMRLWLFCTPVALLGVGGIALVWLLRRMKGTRVPTYEGPPSPLDPGWYDE